MYALFELDIVQGLCGRRKGEATVDSEHCGTREACRVTKHGWRSVKKAMYAAVASVRAGYVRKEHGG